VRRWAQARSAVPMWSIGTAALRGPSSAYPILPFLTKAEKFSQSYLDFQAAAINQASLETLVSSCLNCCLLH
jgi:hypothetical protein